MCQASYWDSMVGMKRSPNLVPGALVSCPCPAEWETISFPLGNGNEGSGKELHDYLSVLYLAFISCFHQSS